MTSELVIFRGKLQHCSVHEVFPCIPKHQHHCTTHTAENLSSWVLSKAKNHHCMKTLCSIDCCLLNLIPEEQDCVLPTKTNYLYTLCEAVPLHDDR